jgi:RNA polymerase sigma factor (sigma-70 family)
MHDRELLARCQATLTTCDSELGWGLSPADRYRYAAAVCALLLPGASGTLIRDVTVNYHADHALVEALRDARRPEHNAAWAEWMHRTMGVLRANGFGRSDNTLLDPADLVQVANAALVRALPTYRYQSRFSSWAFRVIVQSARNELRAALAQKRAAQPASLDQLAEGDHPADSRSRDEERANSQLLVGMVRGILAAHPNERLGRIFLLWALADQRVADIGALLQLHPTRVRALLREARALLQNSHAIREWRGVDAAEAPN